MDVLPEIYLSYGYDGSAVASLESHDNLPSHLQEPFSFLPSSRDFTKQLCNEYLNWDINDTLKQLAFPGHLLDVQFRNGLQHPECSLPDTLIVPELPPVNDVDASGWAQVKVKPGCEGPGFASALDVARLKLSRGSVSDTWNGMTVSTPFMPGNGPTAATTPGAAMEAEAQKWVDALRRGEPLEALAPPGLRNPVFGGWTQSEEDCKSVVRMAPPSKETGDCVQSPEVLAPALISIVTAAPGGERVKLSSLFKDAWMMVDEEAEKEREKEEVEAEEAKEQAQAQGLITVPVLPSPSASALMRVAAPDEASTGTGLLNKLLTSGGGLEGVLARDKCRVVQPQRVPRSDFEWAVRGGVGDVEQAYAAVRPFAAMSFSFELDTFQKEAVVHLERGNNVFVAAHTSAGKTVVAEYAFALATKHRTRAVYTSPIKTISNQKFRDFSNKFEVGLVTGDVQLRTSAACLIMTTEILRSMLYRGADLVRDIEWVIFDEVHYVNDAERGVVWEEVIIMLPPHVNLVLLSATVPNVMEFADWVGRTKRRVVYVTGTNKRPVPLEHNIYCAGDLFAISTPLGFNDAGYRAAVAAVRQKAGTPETKTQEKAARPTGRGEGRGPNAARGRGGARSSPSKPAGSYNGSGPGGGPNSSGARGERAALNELMNILKARTLLPVAVFCFSKKRCDGCADLLSTADFTTSSEKHAIHAFIERCLARLKPEDRTLPQILRLRDLLRRGLAVHHAGLLPIMKEVVEMLFCQGLLRVLFCTETFAMGVNAPTRCVVFHSLRKYDSKDFRLLLPGEYTQMAGRAGRRGLDAVGTVIVPAWNDELPTESELKTLLVGRGVTLESQFRLTYGMILNMLRLDGLKVEDMLKRSFAEWRAQRQQPKVMAELDAIERQLGVLSSQAWPSCFMGCTHDEVVDYYDLTVDIREIEEKLQEEIANSRAAQQALVPGRLVLYFNPINSLTELGVVLGPADALPGGGQGRGAMSYASAAGPSADRKYVVLLLHRPGVVDSRHQKKLEEERQAASQAAAAGKAAVANRLEDEFQGLVLRAPKGREGEKGGGGPGTLPRYGDAGGLSYMVESVGLRSLVGICRAKVTVSADELMSGEWGSPANTRALTAALREIKKAQDSAVAGGTGEPPLLDPRQDLKLASLQAAGLADRRNMLCARRASLRPHACPGTSDQVTQVRSMAQLRRRRDELTHVLSDASLSQLPEFQLRVAVLQQLGYLDEEHVVSLKGRVCAEINSTQNELVATEAVFAGLMSELTPAEAVALLSSLVFQERSDVEPELTPALSAAYTGLVDVTRATARVQAEAGLGVNSDDFVQEVLHPGLMQVVYEWARGTPFSELMDLTDVMEGSIVRAVVRLEAACHEFMEAARVMGNTTLFDQMEAASAAIKRDVVFAASLYVA